MKNTALLFVLSALLFGCQKENVTKTGSATRKMTFAINGLHVQVADMETKKTAALPGSASVSALQDQLNQLAFVIYDESGNEVKRLLQYAPDENFGSWTTELPVDQSFIMKIIGSTQSFNINSYDDPVSSNPVLTNLKTARMMYLQPNESAVEHLYQTGDTFFRTIGFNTYNESKDQEEISLSRIVGKLEFDIADTENYTVQIVDEATEFAFDLEKSEGSIDVDLGHSPVKHEGTPLSFYILRTDRPLRIRIEGGGVAKELEVPVFKNKRTVVSGNLLTTATTSSLRVLTLEDEWAEDADSLKF